MDERASSPQTTLVILLGASEWPEFSDFHDSQAFVHVAVDFSRYILDPQQFGLPRENFLNLFDTDLSPDKIDKEIRQFLDHRTSEMKQVGKDPTDLLFYFVGHGGFVGRNSEYYLAARCTSRANPAVSGIRIEPLATTITDRARYLRRLIILDCCYAAAAFTAFQAEGPAQVAIRQTVDVFKEKAKRVGKGTSLLCSSGKKVPSLLTAEDDYTIFSRALLHVLSTRGNPYRPDEAYLSLREVADLTEEVLDSLLEEQAPRPELHSPDQVDGDVADVPFFPNPVVKAVEASQSKEVLSRQEGSVEKPASTRPQDRSTWLSDEISAYVPAPSPGLSPQHVSIPVVRGEPKLVRQVVSRRTMVLGLGLAGLAVASGGIAWLAFSHALIPISPGTVLYTYRGHSDLVLAVAWSPDSLRIASASADKTVQVWDAADGGHVYTYRGHDDFVWSVAWSPDGRYIATASSDGTVQVWDAADGERIYTYHGHANAQLGAFSVAWSPDGQRIASGGSDGTVQVWDEANGGHVYTYRGHSEQVHAVAWAPDGKRIASGSYDNTVQVWDATDGGQVYTYHGHTYWVVGVTWSPDGKRIASGSWDTTVQVWDAANGGHVYIYHGHSSAVLAVRWSPDGTRIASGSGTPGKADRTVQVWEAV